MPNTLSQAMAQRIRTEYAQPSTRDTQQLKKTATELEAVFLQQFLQAMDATVDRSDNPLGGGEAEETFRGLMHQEMAGNMAKSAGQGIGLAQDVFAQAFQFLNQKPFEEKEAAAKLAVATPQALPATAPVPASTLNTGFTELKPLAS